jgi:ribosome maturation factor RimP
VLLKSYEVGVGAHFFHDVLIIVRGIVLKEDVLETLIEPEVERLGFEVVKMEVVGAIRNPIVRLFIDKPGGVSIKDCALVSRALGLILDDADPFPGRYLLEVSSPGNNRPLAKASHFERFRGRWARVQSEDSGGTKSVHTGLILSCIDGVLTLETDGGELAVNLEDITKANLIGVEYKIDKKIRHEKRNKGGK